MYSTMEQVRERQRAMLSVAEDQRHALQARRLSRATRRAERAERQLARSWSHATRRRDELTRIATDPWDQ
jgi:hypothetical protein